MFDHVKPPFFRFLSMRTPNFRWRKQNLGMDSRLPLRRLQTSAEIWDLAPPNTTVDLATKLRICSNKTGVY